MRPTIRPSWNEFIFFVFFLVTGCTLTTNKAFSLPPVRNPNQQIISPYNTVGTDFFGRSVSISGNLVIVGKQKAQIFRASSAPGSSFAFEQMLEPIGSVPTQFGEDEFGSSVAIQGDLALVSADKDSQVAPSHGAVYVFRKIGTAPWIQEAKLLPNPGNPTDPGFGGSLAILSSDTIAVSAYADAAQMNYGGQVYIFKKSRGTWSQIQKFGPPDPNLNAFFGASISYSFGRLAIGAYGHRENNIRVGGAYIYHLNTQGLFDFEQKIIAADGALDDTFGTSVALLDNRVAVGSPNDDDVGANSGSMYIFKLASGLWSQEQKLLPQQLGANEQFASRVALSGSRAYGGIPKRGCGGWNGNCGVVAEFNRVANSWVEESELHATTPTDSKKFGSSLAATEGRLLVGIDGVAQDEVYAFTVPITQPAICIEDINGDEQVDVDDLLEVINHWGQAYPPADVTLNGIVNVDDLLAVINAWGLCD